MRIVSVTLIRRRTPPRNYDDMPNTITSHANLRSYEIERTRKEAPPTTTTGGASLA